jgi:hypothetical protein
VFRARRQVRRGITIAEGRIAEPGGEGPGLLELVVTAPAVELDRKVVETLDPGSPTIDAAHMLDPDTTIPQWLAPSPKR